MQIGALLTVAVFVGAQRIFREAPPDNNGIRASRAILFIFFPRSLTLSLSLFCSVLRRSATIY